MNKYNYDNLVEIVANAVQGWVGSIGDCATPEGIEQIADAVSFCSGILEALKEFDDLYRVGRG